MWWISRTCSESRFYILFSAMLRIRIKYIVHLKQCYMSNYISLELVGGGGGRRGRSGSELLLFSCSVMSDSETPWTAAHQASLSFTVSQSFLKLMSVESMMPSNHLILCRPFSSWPVLPASVSFPVSQLFTSGGQSVCVLCLCFGCTTPCGLQGLISLTRDWTCALGSESTES